MLSVTLAKRTDPGKTIASDEDGNNRAAGGVSFFAWPRTNMKGRGFALLHSRSCGHGKNTRNNVDQKSEVGRKFSVIVFRVPVVRDAVHAKLRFSFARCAAVVPPVSRSFFMFFGIFPCFHFFMFFFFYNCHVFHLLRCHALERLRASFPNHLLSDLAGLICTFVRNSKVCFLRERERAKVWDLPFRANTPNTWSSIAPFARCAGKANSSANHSHGRPKSL